LTFGYNKQLLISQKSIDTEIICELIFIRFIIMNEFSNFWYLCFDKFQIYNNLILKLIILLYLTFKISLVLLNCQLKLCTDYSTSTLKTSTCILKTLNMNI